MEGKSLYFIDKDKTEDINDKVSFRILSDYLPLTDITAARIDILTYKDGLPYKQYNCGFEIKEDKICLPLPKGTLGGITSLLSKEALINMFKNFIERLENET